MGNERDHLGGEVLPAYDKSMLPHVGTYRRRLPVSLQRMYENALDWEHLPYVHASSFRSIDLIEAARWGWRASSVSAADKQSVIELSLDRGCRRWITRTLDGYGRGTEIWTHVVPLADRSIEIVVDFFVPGVRAERRGDAAASFSKLYARLYDEDVAMMVERQEILDQLASDADKSQPSGALEVSIGRRSELKLPLTCRLGRRDYVVADVCGHLRAYPARCPHLLGPLANSKEGGIVECPWHGYRFDVATGECISGQGCRLAPLPVLSERENVVFVSLALPNGERPPNRVGSGQL